MKKKASSILLSLSLFLSLSLSLHAQDRKTFRKLFVQAEYYSYMQEYDEALNYYTKLLDMDGENYNVLYLTGDCYLNLPGRKAQAIPYLEEAISGMTEQYKDGSYKERNAPDEALYSLARAYQVDGQFAKARDFYIHYRQIMSGHSYADLEFVNKQIRACEGARQMMAAAGNITLVRTDGGGAGAGASLPDQAYNPLVSANDSVRMFMSNDPSRRAIYMSLLDAGGWTEPVLINEELGAYGDCMITCISRNGKELYMTRTDNLDADIYVSHFSNGRWGAIIRLKGPVNSTYYESHASLSGDGQTLYFTSDRKGGAGALDIYLSHRLEEDDWGDAENLGGIINTAYNEDSPFITDDGQRLYFSSQGHETMGGYDVFYCRLLSDGSWSAPVNIGYPLNSGDDEVFYVPLHNGTDGLMSTARNAQEPGIYTVRYNAEPLAQAGSGPEDHVEKAPDAGPEPVRTTDRNLITVHSIMFGYNSDRLGEAGEAEADKIYRIMRDFPDISLEVTGHTDATGTAGYNKELSERRAGSVVDYLAGRGIGQDRMVVRGAGASGFVAINRNPDGSDSPEGRQFNRYASVRFLNFENERITVEDINVPEHLRPVRDLGYTVVLAELDERDRDISGRVEGTDIREVETGDKYLYIADPYRTKPEATDLLNRLLDEGYPTARLVEKRALEHRIRKLAEEGGQAAEHKRYTIQVMALKRARDPGYFSGLPGLKRFQGDDGLNRYIIGDFGSIREAMDSLPAIRAKGYPDAFIMNLKHYR